MLGWAIFLIFFVLPVVYGVFCGLCVAAEKITEPVFTVRDKIKDKIKKKTKIKNKKTLKILDPVYNFAAYLVMAGATFVFAIVCFLFA